MIEYYKQELAKGAYIATHGRWESAVGTMYSPGSIGGISFMSREGNCLYEMHNRHFTKLTSDLDLISHEWGDRSTSGGGGTEYRLKEWHDIEFNL